MIEDTKHFEVEESVAVGTEAFRKAENGVEVLMQIGTELGVESKLISPEQEARYGYLSAAALVEESNLIVWDTGAGSTQMSSLDEVHTDSQGSGTVLKKALMLKGAV